MQDYKEFYIIRLTYQNQQGETGKKGGLHFITFYNFTYNSNKRSFEECCFEHENSFANDPSSTVCIDLIPFSHRCGCAVCHSLNQKLFIRSCFMEMTAFN